MHIDVCIICFCMCVDLEKVGGSCSGKSSVVQTLAELTGHKLMEFPMNSDTDTTELLGGFQQVYAYIYNVYSYGMCISYFYVTFVECVCVICYLRSTYVAA